ncbi:uncharacterized protein RBU33_018591 [Hipposideros larvatus]
MSRHQVNRSNTSSHLNQPKHVSFSAQTPGWSQCPDVTRVNSLKPPHTLSGSEFNRCSSPSEQSNSPSSLKLPVRRICMGRPYNAEYVETSHLANRLKVAKKPTCHGNPYCLLCTDRPVDPSSPTFLDQLIKGINYLDRSTNAFYTNCPKSLSLPRLAANCLERAANSIHLNHPDHSSFHSYSNNDTSTVPCTRRVNALQCVADSINTSCPHQLPSQNVTPVLPQRPGVKLPEVPLFGNGIFSLGHLPKFWEAIRSGWKAPKPISKPWW